MIKISLKEFADILGYQYQGEEDIYFNKLVLDSRKADSGDLFVAVKGDNTDGHKYIDMALKNGVSGVVSIGGSEEIILEKTNYITVPERDSLEEFLKKAGEVIKSKISSKVVGVTGSVGKTTTKDMLFSVLKKEYKVIKTEGNFNNELGLPITMSRADENTDWMILEMGMRGPGEIRYLADIAKPDYAIITSIEPVHAEVLGSIENIAKTKAEICEGISENGFVIINFKDKELLTPCLEKCKGKIYTVGYSSKADFFIKDINNINEKTTQFSLINGKRKRVLNVNASGRHNVQNAAAVTAFCDLAGINEEALLGLNEIEFSEMRFNQKEISDVKIINDAYNANPSSTCFSLETLTNIKGKRKIFIFADMFELGDYEKTGHEQVAEKIVETQVDLIFLLGEKVSYTYDKLGKINYNMSNVFFFKEKNKLLEKIKEVINKGDVILLKGSRGMHLEEVEKGIEEFLNVL